MAEDAADFDLIVLGAGSAGLGLSLFMARIKLRVLLIDLTAEDVGGDCLNHGCVPSKALIHASRQVHQARQASQFGLQVSGQADMAKVMDYVRERQAVIRYHENPDYLRGLGITVEIGRPAFVGDHAVEINGHTYRGRKLAIATGSRPQQLHVPGAELVRLYDNQCVWDLRELPRRLLVVGGGPNGVELGQAMQRLGAQVTLVHHGASILEKEDPAIRAVLAERLRAEGLILHLEAEVETFTSASQARIKPKAGNSFSVDFDLVYVAIGRHVSFEGLALERAGVEVDEHGHIRLNEHLQTTNPDIFVAGDAANSLKFSLDAAELDKLGTAYERWETDFADDDRAVVDSYRDGRLLLFIEKNAPSLPGRKRRILGGAMVAPGAGEPIQELILANASGLAISEIFDKVYPYPVVARINQKLIVEHQEVSPLLQTALDVAFKLQ